MKSRVLLGILLIAAGIAGIFLAMNHSRISFGNFFNLSSSNVNIVKTVDASDIRDIKISAGSSDISVVRGSSDQIEARLKGTISSNRAGDVKLDVDTKGDSLILEASSGTGIGISYSELVLTVELPEKVWDSVSVETGSGNINAEQIDSGKIELNAGSGDVELVRYSADKLTFDIGSGNVELIDGQSALKGETSSGNITVKTGELTQDTILEAGSGNVIVQVDREPESLEVDFEGGSGEGNVDWKGMKAVTIDDNGSTLKGTFGSGDALLKVRTGSGNFKLK